jgi:1-acyl-sn-glycerol-3-phosphate acyltransferase
VGDANYRGIITLARGALKGLGLRIDIVGAGNIPREGGAVLAINHIGYLDFVLAGIPADLQGHRLVRFMAKEPIFEHPIAGPLMRTMKLIPVDRDAGTAAFRAGVDALKAGELVGVFPEATMSRSMEIKEIKSGAVRMARSAKVPLIPMVVFGTQRLITYGHRDLSRGKAICITVGEPVPTAGDPEHTTQALHARLVELHAQTLDRYPDKPVPGDDWWWPKRLGGTAPTLEEAKVLEAEFVAEKAARKAAKQQKKA